MRTTRLPFSRGAGGAAILAALAATLAGCGEQPATRVEGRTLRMSLEEYRFVPQVVRAQAGRLTIVARNRGVLAHNVGVGRGRFVRASTPTLHPGESGSVTVTLERGDYRLVCTVGNHDDLGMYGTLIVR